MELVGILRVLWRRRVLVGLGAAVALTAGILATHRVSIAPPGLTQTQTGTALARAQVFVDTPRTLVAGKSPRGHETIATRAALLGGLLASDDLKAEIAHRAGLRASELGVFNQYWGTPAVPTPLSQEAVDVARPNEPNVVTVNVADPQMPILSILAQAPTPDHAARLVEAATAATGSLVSRPANGTPAARIERLDRPVISRVAGSRALVEAGIAAVLVFALWCSAVFLVDRIIQRPFATPPVIRDRTRTKRRSALDL